MFGDTDTVAEDTSNDGNDGSMSSPTWSGSEADTRTSATGWGEDWAQSAPAASPQPWETASFAAQSNPDPAAFAGWGALGSTDSPGLNHDLSSWDSSTDAAVAETSPAPWAVETAAEVPQWSALSGWGTPQDIAVEHNTDEPFIETFGLDATNDAPDERWDDGEPTEPVEAIDDRWDAPEADVVAEQSAGPSELLNEPELGGLGESAAAETDPIETFETPPVDIWSDVPPMPTLPSSFLSGTVNDEPDSSGVPFHEIAAALASADAVPLATRTSPTPLATSPTHDEVTGSDTAPIKRRGRLAARTARETLAKNALEGIDDEASVPSTSDAIGETIVAPAKKTPSKFFAKKDPTELADAGTSRETPKILRVAALVSLLVGVGLFAFTVVNSRSSDSTPEISPTVPVLAPELTVPPAPVASTVPVADPIFGGDSPIPSAPAPTPSSPIDAAQPADDDLSFSDPGDFSS